MKTYTKSQITEMLENKEISKTEAMVLEFKRNEYEDASELIELGKIPKKMYGRKFHPIHIQKIVLETLRINGRMIKSASKEFAARYGLSYASVEYISQSTIKMAFPDRYPGKIKRSDSHWVNEYIRDTLKTADFAI